jgi:hypothetical protein
MLRFGHHFLTFAGSRLASAPGIRFPAGDVPMKLRRAVTLAFLLALVGAASVAVAQNPFVGSWKLNQGESNLTGTILKFGPAEGESIELSANGTVYSFRLDGKNYRMASGDLAVWAEADPATWTTEYKKPDGTPLSTDAWKLSSDGQTLTVTSTGTKPDKDQYTDTAIYMRTAGTSGLMGAWKSTEVKLGSPDDFSIDAYGLGGLVIKIPSLQWTCLATFGGKDAVPTGPTVPPGLTVVLERTGPSSFRLAKKINGNAFYSSLYTVSEDGKRMTEVGNASGDPQQTFVWEKQ